MAKVRISAAAERDIDEIAAYSMAKWGWRQVDLYLAKIEDGIDLLASNPSIGRACESIRAGLRRFETGRHVIFYLIRTDGILVVRVLHQRMMPANYV
ncbi:MAG TPA: type II toxin-antitoxin system RelE/ParE family toxin [Terracidiphilus sp.]|nr:type II toxin-antitoxin system RelE/ParE family toxin [Terracidiphilus sp.]